MVIDDCFVEDLGDGATGARRGDEFAGAMHVVCAQHNIDPRRTLAHAIAIFLRHASGHHQLATLDAVFPALEMTKVSVGFGVGAFANATGVDHHDIGCLFGLGKHQAVGFEHSGDALGVVLIHLAPICANDVAAAHRVASLLRAGPAPIG